jgi:cysteine desulfurase / selenocysteine lyase
LHVRADFPIFARRFDGRELIYLDSGATSQKPAVVIDALSEHLRAHNANVHRGVYALAQEADAAYDGARRRVAAFVGADRSSGIDRQTTVFTKNVTEAINLVAYSWGRGPGPAEGMGEGVGGGGVRGGGVNARARVNASTNTPTQTPNHPPAQPNIGPGDAILITQLEHHANIVPWQILCRERGAQLRYLEVDSRGELSLDQLDAELARGDVRLVAFSHVSNVLGTITPVAEMTARIRAAGAISLVDGAQAVPHMPVDVPALGADFYAWTGHKALGPTGIGVLHGRTEIMEQMEPFMTGGDMIASVDLQSATWNELPYKFEAGTPPIAEAVGLGAAVDYLSGLGMARVREHERALTAYMLERLTEIPGLRVVGPPEAERRGGLASFTIEGIHPHDIAELCSRNGVCIRAGHHCAQPLMRCLGVGATARASVGVYNEPSDIDALVDALQTGREVFGL